MNGIKWIGAAMILSASSWIGFQASASLRRVQRHLNEFVYALDIMETEVRFQRTGFEEICGKLAAGFLSSTGLFFRALAQYSASGSGPSEGMTSFACRESGILLPPGAMRSMERLVDQFGVYDTEGQLRMIDAARTELSHTEQQVKAQLEQRCRTFCTLGVCAGAALLILVI